MQVFRVAPGETPSERWLEAFPDAVIERPPFATERGAHQADVCWISTGIDGWRDEIRRQAAHCRVVAHSRRPTDDEAIEALDAGAHGYCHSLSNVSILRAIVSTVTSGSLWVGPGVITRMIRTLRHSISEPPERPPEAFATLTAREREVALAVTTGATNKEIAQQLGMTERTVKMHLGSIFQKLGVRDRVHLVLLLAKPTFEPVTRH
jgi:two-component system, NarL family, nitrate/nitrite response regulator NarL